MEVTQWNGNWKLRQETDALWRAVCPRCDTTALPGYTEQEAITVAKEKGWIDGFCSVCWELLHASSNAILEMSRQLRIC
jgi:hypothetical protein